MKKLIILACAAVVLAACAKENDAVLTGPSDSQNGPSADMKTIVVGLDINKTALGPENNGVFPIVWSEGDEIAVVENMGVAGQQNCSIYRLKSGAGTSNGLFEHVAGTAFPKVITDVVYPAAKMAPQGVELNKIPVTSIDALVPKVQTQTYVKDSFDPEAVVMYFHSDKPDQQPIVLQPASSIVCIPVAGSAGDKVKSVVWKNMDGRTVRITLNCPEPVALSAEPVNFYLSIPPMLAKCHGIAYVNLVNGVVNDAAKDAVQVKTPKNLEPFKAGELHRFPTWTLSRKAKWTIKYIGSQRDDGIKNQTPYGLGKYMIDDNPYSWWEFKRKLKSDGTGGQMVGPHKVIIDLGKTEHITGLKIKGAEVKEYDDYGILITSGKNAGKDIAPQPGYNPPHTLWASFLKEGELTDEFINTFKTTHEFTTINPPKITHPQVVHQAGAGTNRANYYGDSNQYWWDIPLSKEYDARYLVIHFRYAWDNLDVNTAEPVMKVAELDIY